MWVKEKNQNGFCSDLLTPPQPCAQPAPNQIRHALAWRNARPGTVRAATRARGSSLRNCTFWKEPSNHEFRVFVDEYLITNLMMSFLPPIAARRGGYQKSNLWRWAPKRASFGANLQPGAAHRRASRPELPTASAARRRGSPTPILTGQPAAGSSRSLGTQCPAP